MLRSVSQMLVMNRLREAQDRRTTDSQFKKQQDFSVVATVQSALDILGALGFYVAIKTEEPTPGSVEIAELALEKWKMASTATRQKVRAANPELGLALDRMETVDLATPAGKAMAGMLAVFAQFEREETGDA